MKLTDEQKDLLSAVAVGVLNMIFFVLLMGTMAVWGQTAGSKVRTKIHSHRVDPQPEGTGRGATADSLKDT